MSVRLFGLHFLLPFLDDELVLLAVLVSALAMGISWPTRHSIVSYRYLLLAALVGLRYW